MSEIASAKINSFGKSPKADFVSPSTQLITLTIGQLQDIITQAVKKANQPLQDRIESLEKMVAAQDAKIAALTSTQEQDVNRICLDIAYDRQRLAKLEQSPAFRVTAPTTPPQGEKTISRIAKVKDFLKTRGGGATFQECERLLSIRPNQMTKLVFSFQNNIAIF